MLRVPHGLQKGQRGAQKGAQKAGRAAASASRGTQPFKSGTKALRNVAAAASGGTRPSRQGQGSKPSGGLFGGGTKKVGGECHASCPALGCPHRPRRAGRCASSCSLDW